MKIQPNFLKIIKVYFICGWSFCFCQNYISNIFLDSFPINLIKNELDLIIDNDFNSNNTIRPLLLNNKGKKTFELGFSNQLVINSGHPNIDNSGIFYALNGNTNMTSFYYTISKKNLFIQLSPYQINKNIEKPDISELTNPFAHLNSSYDYKDYNKSGTVGLRESLFLLHYKGFGVSYGNMNNWWGPGMHSSMTFSSNSSGFRSIQFGTFRPININKVNLNFRVLATQMKNKYNNPYFLTGSAFSISYKSDPTFTIGVFRYHLSGGFGNLSDITSLDSEWSLKDAVTLIFEPLFGQSKTGLQYTNIGSPGYDKWDQVLTGFGELIFPKDHLKIYFEISSDDNRANFTDLKAHWDHTLGYLYGFRKYYYFNNNIVLFGFEYLSTKTSNTMKFWRGGLNQENYYTRKEYDFSSFNGRRFGAHSGSSSDDLIFMFGLGNEKSMAFVSYNNERHGIKSMTHPELKTEYVMSFNRNISDNNSAFIKLEYEKIKNFGFIQNNISVSKLVWLGYSFTIN